MAGSGNITLRFNDRHRLECDWGEIEHSEPRPELGQLGPLMIATADYIAELARDGPKPSAHDPEVTHSVSGNEGRVYAHIDYRGMRYTWALYEAVWWDGAGPRCLVGRWDWAMTDA